MAELTPMKRQYYEIKEKHQDCLLFFRLGDFYEMFDEDAKLASRELDSPSPRVTAALKTPTSARPCAACRITAPRRISAG